MKHISHQSKSRSIILNRALLCIASLSLILILGCTSSDNEAFPESEGWVSLFNGKDLTGWGFKIEGAKEIWSVKDGVIDCEPILKMEGDKNIWSSKVLKDFTLHAEWRLKRTEGIYNTPTVLPDGSYLLDSDGEKVTTPSPGADSGIYLRGSSKAQLNIWTWPIGSGEVYGYRNNQKDPLIRAGVTPKVNADNPVGEWNTFHVTLKGDRLTVDLNGKRVLDNAQLPGIPESGPIVLQHHGGYDSVKQEWNGASSLVQFRNIHIKEL